MTSSSLSYNEIIDASQFCEMENDLEKLLQAQEEYKTACESLDAISLNNENGEYSLNDLNERMLELALYSKKAKITDELDLDGKLFGKLLHLGKTNINKTEASFLSFDPLEYVMKLENFVGEEANRFFNLDSLALNRLSSSMLLLYRSTEGLDYFCGALSSVPAERQRAERKPNEPQRSNGIKTLEKVDGSASLDGKERSQDDEVHRIFDVLKKRFRENDSKPIALMEFILDPKCFMTSVQNSFHMSFLVRDNHVEISEDEENIPYIRPLIGKERERVKHLPNYQPMQGVISLNVETYKELIELLDISEPMIPRATSKLKRTHVSR